MTYDGFDTMPIAGQWRVGRLGETADDVDPWSDDVLVRLPLANADDADAAFRGAADAQPDWAATLPTERAEVFHRAARIMEDRRDEIVDWLIREAGGIRPRAEWEWTAVRAVLLESASYPTRAAGAILPAALIPGKENRVYKRPLGVVTVISPWNFPLQLSARSVAPALALGNAVVLKPASTTPITGGLLLAKILEEAGLPPGVLSVVIGPSRELGDVVVTHPLTRFVSFTGSTPVGEHIATTAPMTRRALELGGNGPLLILDDADLDAAVDAATFGSFFHQGQICMATNRVVVADAVYDEVVDRLTERVRSLVTGDPKDPATQIGPMIDDDQLGHVLDLVERAEKDGADVRVRGERSGPAGRVLGPHLLLGTNDVATAAEEVFGPVATVIRARDDDDAVRIANDTEYGLSSAVFSRDVERAVRVGLRIDAGMTHVNDTTVNDEPNTAFGGEKGSGVGRFGGEWAIDEFTTDHWIGVQRTRRDYAI